MSLITLNPNDKTMETILSNNNLTVSCMDAPTKYKGVRVSSNSTVDKWYLEIMINSAGNRVCIGMVDSSVDLNGFGSGLTGMPTTVKVLANSGIIYNGNITVPNGSFTTGDIIGLLYNSTTKTLIFRKNNVFLYELQLDITFNWMFAILLFNSSDKATANFGASPFAYPIPEGYLPYDINNANWFVKNKYLFQCENSVMKPIMEGLEKIGDMRVTVEMFEQHGTEYLPDIIGVYNKDVDMIYKEDLEDIKLYRYKLVGYTDIDKLEISNKKEKANYIRLIAQNEGSIGIAVKIAFYDIDNIPINISDYNYVIVSHNMNQRIGDINFKMLFGLNSQLESPYYAGTGKAFYIIKIPKNAVKIQLRNWSNTAYGKPYLIEVSSDMIDFETVTIVNTNGNDLTYMYDISFISSSFEIQALIKQNNKHYMLKDNEFIEVEPTVENFELYGRNLLDIVTTPTDKIRTSMNEKRNLGNGKEFSKVFNMTEFKKKFGKMKKINEV